MRWRNVKILNNVVFCCIYQYERELNARANAKRAKKQKKLYQ